MMNQKITRTRHIRQQLETLHQQKYKGEQKLLGKINKYKGLGLNWRDIVILIMSLFFVGLYQVQAHAQDYFSLDDVDTGMMLSYNQTENNYTALTLVSSAYNVDITGIVAEVKILQTFKNNTANWVKEGMYAFPVAQNAAVHHMKFIVGNRVIEGEIHEKKQAQVIYEEAKSQGLAASIVKQYRPNLFITNVANIMPSETVKVEITYQQTLKYDAGHIDFRLPLAIKSRYMQERYLADYESFSSKDSSLQDINPIATTINYENNRYIHINLESGFDLSELTSLNHDVNIIQSGVYNKITLSDSHLYDKNDFVLRWYPTQENVPQAAMFSERFNGEEYVLMMLLPPKISKKITQKREMIFIIDTSGSMHGKAMLAAKDALLFGLTQLASDDLFNIVEFSTYAKELFSTSVVANSKNIENAINFIDDLYADGGTNMDLALDLSMQDEVKQEYLKQIVFITDGSVGNEADLFIQINQNIGDARLFTVAIGSAPNSYFMSKAALIGKGTYTTVTNLDDVDKNMNELFMKLSSPALTDVMIEWGTQVIQNPRVIPDLYSDEPVVITAKMQDFNKQIALSGFADKSTWSQSFNLNKDGLSIGIAKLWARNQIEDLTDDLMLGADIDADNLQQEITEIALNYHLVSQFTSLVAVDKTPDISRLVQIQALSEGQNNTSVISQTDFPQTALGWKWQLLIGLMFISMAFSIKRKR